MGESTKLFASNYNQRIGPAFRPPNFALAAQKLTHAGTGSGARMGGEFLGDWVEHDNCIGAKIGEPDLVFFIDVNRISPWVAAGKFPSFPGFNFRGSENLTARIRLFNITGEKK